MRSFLNGNDGEGSDCSSRESCIKNSCSRSSIHRYRFTLSADMADIYIDIPLFDNQYFTPSLIYCDCLSVSNVHSTVTCSPTIADLIQSLSFGSACIILYPVRCNEAATRTRPHMHLRLRMPFLFVCFFNASISQKDKHNLCGSRTCSIAWPTHNTSILSMHGYHTHAQSRLHNVLMDTASSLFFFSTTNPTLQLLRPAVIGLCCQSTCLPTS